MHEYLRRLTKVRFRRATPMLVSITDQALVASLNFLVLMATARLASPAELGIFVLLQAISLSLMLAFRALPGMWLITLGASATRETQRSHLHASQTLALSLGALSATGVAAIVSLVDRESLFLALLIGLSTPGLLVVTALRMHAYSLRRPFTAFSYSASAVLLFIGFLFILRSTRTLTWIDPSVAFLLSTTLLCLIALVRVGWSPRPHHLLTFLRSAKHEWLSATTNVAAISARQLVIPYVVAGLAGLPAAAAIRGAQTLSGLVLQVGQGLQPVFLASGAQALKNETYHPLRTQRSWNLIQISIFAPFIVIVMFIPDRFGRLILGETWPSAADVLPWVLLSSLIGQVILGLEIHLRVVGRLQSLSRSRLIGLAPTIGLVAFGAATFGPIGAAIGMLVGALATLTLVLTRSPFLEFKP